MPKRRNTNEHPEAISISLASMKTGVEIHTLRYWEMEFSDFLHPVRTRGGQRRYRAEDIETVLLIKRLLREEMYSIAGAKRHLRSVTEKAA
jgi:DNA-binding transcriptional MerR regulator